MAPWGVRALVLVVALVGFLFLDDLCRSEGIALATFRQRPWVQHMAGWAANLITRVL